MNLMGDGDFQFYAKVGEYYTVQIKENATLGPDYCCWEFSFENEGATIVENDYVEATSNLAGASGRRVVEV